MKNIATSLRSIALTGLLVVGLPMAASAYSLGVSNTMEISNTSGHVTTCTTQDNRSTGTSWTYSNAEKKEHGDITGSTTASTADPTSSTSNMTGKYNIVATTQGGSNGTYDNHFTSSSSLHGAQTTDTAITHSVSAFVNP